MKPGTWPLLASSAFFLAYAANIVSGLASGSTFLGDVGEMVTLFASAISFVICILEREANDPRKKE
jgi:hypothetical protein